jgi:hypothetical protein
MVVVAHRITDFHDRKYSTLLLGTKTDLSLAHSLHSLRNGLQLLREVFHGLCGDCFHMDLGILRDLCLLAAVGEPEGHVVYHGCYV